MEMKKRYTVKCVQISTTELVKRLESQGGEIRYLKHDNGWSYFEVTLNPDVMIPNQNYCPGCLLPSPKFKEVIPTYQMEVTFDASIKDQVLAFFNQFPAMVAVASNSSYNHPLSTLNVDFLLSSICIENKHVDFPYFTF